MFIGFSDITVGCVTFYGPCVTSLADRDPYTLYGVRRALFDGAPYAVSAHPDDPLGEP